MEKKISIVLLVLICAICITGCACQHEWQSANCLEPEICALCEETQGEPLGHDWIDATCNAPKTCAICGETEGEKLEHQWLDSTCIITCSLCGENDPSAPGHQWVDADCVAAKTCSVCSITDGEPLGHTWVEADCDNPKNCSACGATEGEALDHSLTEGSDGVTGICANCGKAVEIYAPDGEVIYTTVFEIAPNGSYTNPVTYNKRGKSIEWYNDGNLTAWSFGGSYCIEGKIYYHGEYQYSANANTRNILSSNAWKYSDAPYVHFYEDDFHNIYLSDQWGFGNLGSAIAAVDVYGDKHVIVHIKSGSDNPLDTYVVKTNW